MRAPGGGLHGAILFLAGIGRVVEALTIDINDAASQTAYGSMLWYSGNETGQIPGAFPDKWWEGSALFLSLLYYWHYTGDTTYNAEVSQGMEWQAGNGDYMPANYSSYLGNDDQGFWGIAAMTAAEIGFPDAEKGYSWLSLAQGVFNTQVARWDSSDCGGGLRWQIFPYQAGYAMKNSISNGLLFQLAARLARYTNNQTYTEWAEKVWDWSASSPLLNTNTWNVADSTDIAGGCKSQGNNQWSYNYGTYLIGAAYMYNMTEKETWKTAVDGLLGVTLNTFFPKSFNYIMSEVLCEPNEVCNDNEILFKGLVTGWLAFVALLVPSTYDQILPKLQASAQGAAASCSGMSNNTCGVRWHESKWDGWVGMEEQISATDILTSVLVTEKKGGGPLTSTTGGNSTSDPNAGSGDGSSSDKSQLKPITTGDKAGAGIVTVIIVAIWGGLVGFMMRGAAGCTIASRLVSCLEKPSVLLLEAGKENDSNDLLVDGQRWMTLQQPGMDYGYNTVPQEFCNDRQINYSRGRGLGGSTAINFGFWTVGCRGDYDRWADSVGDPRFDWMHMQARFKSLESFQTEDAQASYSTYVAPRREDHGQYGPLKVGYAKIWERDIAPMLDIFHDAGYPLTGDLNSGNPLGIGAIINSCYKGRRTTAATLLKEGCDNLTIITECSVERLVFEGKRVIGVEAAGTRYFASKEVVLSAGSLDTPKLLMLSGIGPAPQLDEYGIPIICDLPAIGQNLKDHCHAPLAFRRSKGSNDRHSFYGEPAASQPAIETWRKDGTGPWSIFGCQNVGGWLKSTSVIDSPEFKHLPRDEQEFLQSETVPHYELVTHFPFHLLMPGVSDDFSYVCLVAIIMNPQSCGEVTLQSTDPSVPLLFNPRFLSHPYDRRVAIESYRDLLKLSAHPSFSKDTIGDLIRPQGDSDDAILEFWKQSVGSTWHMTGTVKMGRLDDPDAAVDSSFRVRNIEGLRVADMSVVPALTNNHTQVTAYLVGATCADVLIDEYRLSYEGK
ncbi:glycosyl hydrolase family 76-domain-containing protein [Aspergillus bertholletiae]|uniref:mannan endo-1,6-alpha-mannosidase n=1 Tax=Aspergillus bertholletiae TaxID=1226010 RepID=A0A5N7B3C5_9EURO|nr:glycosyl hydrolase family 76-domain-containing protein [Aspergillus bertholletiae]